jgi:4-amino-4-deoxy-L-arabinose transferase-like glycosyltransferase
LVSIWTKINGYSEASIRILSLLLTVLATLFLSLSIKNFLDKKRGLAFGAIFATLPLIYIYGKKLDQEALVLLFLSVHLYGLSKIKLEQKYGLALVALGSLGMVLSDWSGLVFCGLLSLSSLMFWNWKEDKNKIIEYSLYTLLPAILGLMIFLIQSYMQSPHDNISAFVKNYYDLWKYRAGVSGDVSWFGWVSKQFTFLNSNYFLPIFIVSIFGLYKSFRNNDFIGKVVLAILSGQLFYIIFLRQASAVHIYYQYFLSIPVAFGLIIFIDLVTRKNQKNWLIILSAVLLINILFTTYQYKYLLSEKIGGTKSDIELVETLKDIPIEKTIVVGEISEPGMWWYQNPNISYYTNNREIKTYLLEEGVPVSDFQLVPSSQVDAYIEAINSGGYGPKVKARKVECSTNICLIELIK